MTEDPWHALAEPFVDGAYASVKGRVRTAVLHQQLLRHLAGPPGRVLDVGGGAAHQSLPLARLGHHVTVLDPSASMLTKAEQRIGAEPDEVRARIRLVQAAGEDAPEATDGQRYNVVLCHGVLMYLDDPGPMITALCRCLEPNGLLSVMALNAKTMAVRPALENRWADALRAFDATAEIGVLGTDTRADTVEGLARLLERGGLTVEAWYGVWLFTDWMELDPDTTDVAAVIAVELEASLRDPYRGLSRVFHLLARTTTAHAT